MIRRIFASDPRFKNLNFGQGLNILLAVKTKSSTNKQTRNGAGKSSVVDLIHFLLGGNVVAESLLAEEALKGWTFGIEMDLGGYVVIAQRETSDPSRTYVRADDKMPWPIKPSLDTEQDRSFFRHQEWNAVLGKLIFDIPLKQSRLDGGAETEDALAKPPTFRALIPYFARRDSDGGFTKATSTLRSQAVGQQQVNITYLLGLDWTISRNIDALRSQNEEIDALNRQSSAGVFKQVMGASSAAAALNEVAQAEEVVKNISKRLEGFQVLPEYNELQREAEELSVKIRELEDEEGVENTSLRDLTRALNVEQQQAPKIESIRRMYDEIGVVIKDGAIKRYEEVTVFHQAVVRNRHAYLDAEITAIKARQTQRQAARSTTTDRWSQIMRTLQNRGALDQYQQLQNELTRAEGRAEALRQKLEALRRLESMKTELVVKKKQLRLELDNDFKERETIIKQAVVAFGQIASSIVDNKAELRVEATDNGPKFTTVMSGKRSKGITHMQIFCFDLVMTKLLHSRGLGPGFLVHDSHLFDGMDPRQTASALRSGHVLCQELGMQYIVIMNSSDVPKASERPDGFAIEDYVIKNVQLTDKTDSGGLFGFRFG